MSITVSLNDNWKMKKAGSQESFDCKVPCSVYKTLLDYKKIPDPYYRENEYISTQICDDDYDLKLHSPQTRPQWSASILSCTLTALIP